jgi:RNA polymerase sigma factor (sigma-70 family)
MTKIRYKRGETVSYTTDSSLLRHVQQGNEDAWNRFYQKYIGMIHSIGKKRRLTPEERDELMIDVMTIFWRKMEHFIYDRNRGKFRSYLGKIADYCAMQIFSKKEDDPEIISDPIMDYPDDVDDALMEDWQNYLLDKALEALRENVDTEVYQVFYMSFIQKCPVAEIAAITRKTPNNIYVIRSRCLSKLTALIKEFRQLDDQMLSSHSHKKDLEY